MDLRFSELFLQALEHARDEALRTGRRGILPDHITLGILRLGSGPAGEIFGRLGLDTSELKQQLDETLFMPDAIPWEERDSLLPCKSTVTMMQHASLEASRCRSGYIEPLHYLIACAREGGTATHEWLHRHGITPRQLVSASGIDPEHYGLLGNDRQKQALTLNPDAAMMAEAIEQRLREGYTTDNPHVS